MYIRIPSCSPLKLERRVVVHDEMLSAEDPVLVSLEACWAVKEVPALAAPSEETTVVSGTVDGRHVALVELDDAVLDAVVDAVAANAELLVNNHLQNACGGHGHVACIGAVVRKQRFHLSNCKLDEHRV